jgi:antitoxin VapB
MALNIKNSEVERLVDEVAKIAGESKTEAVRKALEERRERLAFQVPPRDRRAEVMRYLEREVWPRIPRELLGRGLSKEEQEEILGYGPEGV